MTNDSHRIIHSYFDALNSHDGDKVLSFFADNAQFKDVASDRLYRGLSAIRGMVRNRFKAIPNSRMEITNIVGNDNIYAVEYVLSGKNDGPFVGPKSEMPASGKDVNVPACDLIHLRDGKIHMISCYFAATVMLDQTGTMPVPGKAAA